MHLANLLAQQSALHGEKIAIGTVTPDLALAETLTFSQLMSRSHSIASLLLKDLKRGDRVLLAYANDLEAIQLFWACMVAGVIAIPAPAPDLRRGHAGWRRMQSMCEDARVAMAFTRIDHLAAARTELPQVKWSTLDELGDSHSGTRLETYPADLGAVSGEDIAYLQYTSGSTSQPKGVMISHANVFAQCKGLQMADTVPDPANDRSLVWLPWFHDYGLVHGLLLPMYAGVTSLLMPTQPFVLNPLVWLEAIAKHGVTFSGAPNFAYEACARSVALQPNWSVDLSHWRMATCGAEQVRPSTMEKFAEAFAPYGFQKSALRPSYGLAEAVLGVTLSPPYQHPQYITIETGQIQIGESIKPCSPASADGVTFTSCGTPLTGLSVKIVDPESRKELPGSSVGEVWVSGDGVGLGYWNNDQATSLTFGHKLSDHPDSASFLRTGDLGFLHQDNLYLTGRLKDLILLNGRNVYPQDLEFTAQSAHARVRPEGVIAFGIDSPQGEEVVLLVESRRSSNPHVVHEMVEQVRLAVSTEHEIGIAHVIPLRFGSLPKTSSGKPQRREARRMYLAGELTSSQLKASDPAAALAPDTDETVNGLVAELASLWAEVLHLPDVPADAHFLHLGGDSLTGTQLLSRVRNKWGVDFPISVLFGDPTLLGMARALAARQATTQRVPADRELAAGPNPDAIDGVPSGQLSYSQERMWFMQQLAPTSSAYNVPLALRFVGEVDAGALEHAFKALVNHHEILRTRFVSTEHGPVAEVFDDLDIRLTLLDAPPATDGNTGLSHLISELSQQPFALDHEPLLRTWLIRNGARDHVLLMVLHHIVCDQWSFAVLGRDLSQAYGMARSKMEPVLPGPRPRYASYASWHRHWFQNELQERETAYWSQRMKGLQPVVLVPDRSRPRQPSYSGASVRLPLPQNITETLASLAAGQGASLAMALLALFKVFLMKHTGQTDLAVGMPIANRHHPASEQLIGTLVNTLVIRTSLEGDPDFLGVLQRVKAAALEAYEHQDMPFELLVRTLERPRDPSHPPLFNVMFNLVNTPVREMNFDGLSWSRIDVDRRAAQVDLTVVFDPQFDRSIVLEYATDLFEEESVQRMGQQLMRLLQSVVDHARTPLSQWSPLDPEQQQQLLSWGAGRKVASPDLGLAAFLEQGLKADPDATAVVFGEQRVSYQELDQRSFQLAEHLRANGYVAGCRIGLCLPRSIDLMMALLATIRSGATYVPLDPTYPEDRIGHQIEDADLSLIIGTSETVASTQRTSKVPCLLIDQGWSEPLPAAHPGTGGAAPAYLIYTSGSTGQPKGVSVPQPAVVNFLRSMAREPGLQRGDRVLAVTTLGFDIAVLELLLPLSVGATIVLASDREAADGDALRRLIDEHDITLLQATPSRWQLLLEAGWTRTPGLRALVGGEPLPPTMAIALLERCDQVWNMYGPTETTVWSTCWRVQADTPISLGKAIDNTQILVLDEADQLMPAGAWGEIWIGGSGVADGYWQRPELTAERFRLLDQLQEGEGQRCYRTGDRGRWRHDGSLEHGGRLDNQVKLRGFRIELGEIEAYMASQEGVQRCVAMVREDNPGDQRLVAYIVSTQPSVDLEGLRLRARQWLPDQMVPSHIVQVQALPLLPNGKIDRQSLPRPQGQSMAAGKQVPPSTDTEQRVWQIWQDLLKHGNFGVEDNFFDLGGHSMLAVRLIRRVETEFQCSFNLGALLEQPTIAGIARQLDDPNTRRDKPLAVLRQGQQRPGLFLLAGAQMYQELARQLSVSMPVYGLFSQAEIDLLEWPVDQPLPPFSIEVLAGAYLDLIRAQQPHGPYYLGGYSIGGVLAYEVAQRLQSLGEEVRLLVMLDCALPGHGWRHLWAAIVRRMRIFRRDGLSHLTHLYRQLRLQQAASNLPGGRRIQAYAQAIRQYGPKPSAVPMAFFQAAGDAAIEPAYGWRSLVPAVVIERINGNHTDVLEMPNVTDLARHLSRHLANARDTATTEPRLTGEIDQEPVTART
jgi:amino acid adenylation domain-containing protein